MPYRLDTHVLTVDANVIHKVDTANPANLFSMWTVFSRCADSVEQGRRLENLSWRLWQREQLVENEGNPVPATAATTQTLPQNVPSEARLADVPQLSGSVESLQDDEAVEFTSVSAPLEIRPRIRRLDSSTSSRSKRDRHITSDDFEKMIVSIVKDKAPLSAPTQPAVMMAPRKELLPLPVAPVFERSGSTTTESQSPSKHSDRQSEDSHPSSLAQHATNVVRGFAPAQAKAPVSPRPAQTAAAVDDSIPEPSSSPAPKPVQHKKQPAKFALGGSCSSSEQGQSVEKPKPMIPAALAKKPMFQIGGSSEEEGSLKSVRPSLKPATSALTAQKKQASFSNHVDTRTIGQSDNAVDSDTEAEYVDESAIDDDDDSSDWEDSVEDSGKSSVDEKFFQRVPSKANLTSRPSLITLMLAQNERAKKLGNHTSQSTSAIPRARAGPAAPSLGGSPNDSDEAPLMMKGKRHPTLKPISEIPRSSAQPIAVTTSHVPVQAALSPRTTRRNMLATELTESLRRHLLWERQQKSSTANAVLKRRHTSHDVANLKQFPERPCMKEGEGDDGASWNHYFSKEALNGYHSKGW